MAPPKIKKLKDLNQGGSGVVTVAGGNGGQNNHHNRNRHNRPNRPDQPNPFVPAVNSTPNFAGQTPYEGGGYAIPDAIFGTTPPPAAGGGVTDQTDEDFLDALANNKPLDYFSGVMSGNGQLTGAGPSTYESWLQNQYFNTVYGDYISQKQGAPELGFADYLTTRDSLGPGGVKGIDTQAQNAYNALTPRQRGAGFNPYSGGGGRWTLWS